MFLGGTMIPLKPGDVSQREAGFSLTKSTKKNNAEILVQADQFGRSTTSGFVVLGMRRQIP